MLTKGRFIIHVSLAIFLLMEWCSYLGFSEFETKFQNTPLKTNMSPENQWLEDVFPIQIVSLKRRHVSFSFSFCFFLVFIYCTLCIFQQYVVVVPGNVWGLVSNLPCGTTSELGESDFCGEGTVDGRNPAITSWYGKYPMNCRVSYIPGGWEWDFFHQQQVSTKAHPFWMENRYGPWTFLVRDVTVQKCVFFSKWMVGIPQGQKNICFCRNPFDSFVTILYHESLNFPTQHTPQLHPGGTWQHRRWRRAARRNSRSCGPRELGWPWSTSVKLTCLSIAITWHYSTSIHHITCSQFTKQWMEARIHTQVNKIHIHIFTPFHYANEQLYNTYGTHKSFAYF